MKRKITEEIATFITNLTFKDLPMQVIEAIKKYIVDTIACALAATNERAVKLLRELVLELGGRKEATLWGDGRKVPSPSAARVNAFMSDFYAFNESHFGSFAHICGVTVPVAFAMAEREESDGKELITSIAVGYEMAARIGSAIAPSYYSEKGFHNSIVSVLGGVIAASKLLKLDTERTLHAVSIAATSIGGLRGSIYTMMRQYHACNSAGIAVLSALLATKDFKGARDILEREKGYCDVFSSRVRLTEILKDLGKKWHVLEGAVKFYPGCHNNHGAIETTLTLVKKYDIKPEQVETILIAGNPMHIDVNLIYEPNCCEEALFSLPYMVAACIHDREFTLRQLQLDKICDPSIRTLQKRIKMVKDPSFMRKYGYGGQGAVSISIKTKDGNVYTECTEPSVSYIPYVSWERIERKYYDLTQASISEDKAKKVLQICRSLEKQSSISELIREIIA